MFCATMSMFAFNRSLFDSGELLLGKGMDLADIAKILGLERVLCKLKLLGSVLDHGKVVLNDR